MTNLNNLKTLKKNFGFTGINAGGVLTVVDVANGKTYSAPPNHQNYQNLLEAFKKRDTELFVTLCDIKESVKTFSQGKVEIVGNEVLYNGKPLHNTLVNRMLDMMQEGYDIQPMILFLENLMLNPSHSSVNELYDFMEKTGVCISDDGYIIGYKCVRPDFKDKYSGTIDNSPGQVVKMDRNQVSDNRNKHCSTGLHFGGWSYSGVNGTFYSSGDKVILVRVHPKDVVSVPNDLNEKCRCCEYTVLKEVDLELEKSVFSFDDSQEDYIDSEFFQEDEIYEFSYNGAYRKVLVLKVFPTYIHTRLVKPSENAGQFRNFAYDEIDDVQLV